MADPAEALAQRLLLGASELKAGHPAAAVDSLGVVVRDAELERASDLSDVRARACSLYAQALLETGAYAEASTWVREALRITRSLEDEHGMKVIHSLQAEILQKQGDALKEQAKSERSAALSRVPVATIREEAKSPFELTERLVQRAQASAEGGHMNEAGPIAREALEHAGRLGMTKERVLAHLILARTESEGAGLHIEHALKIARDADETSLITLIAKTADLLEVAIDPHELPVRNRPSPKG